MISREELRALGLDRADNFLGKIINFSIRGRLLVLFLVIVIVVAGLFSLERIPSDIFPDLTMPIFNIITENPGMAQEEVELLISRPIESAMNGIPGVETIRSVTSAGMSLVIVKFSSNTDYYLARQFIAEKINQVIAELPPGTEAPEIGSMTTRLSEIFQYTIKGPNKTKEDLKTLRELAEYQIAYQLMTTPNISAIMNMGGYLRQYQVFVDPYKLQSLDLDFKDIEDAVIDSNESASGSFITVGPTELIVNGQYNRLSSLEDLSCSVVGVGPKNIPILIKDVGDVIDGEMVRRGVISKNMEETVGATVIKQFGSDTVFTIEKLEKNIESINATLPEGYKIEPYYNQNDLIESAIHNVQKTMCEGAIFVIFILFLFLGEIRSAFIVTIVIPTSVIITFLSMYIYGISVNTMSLGGLAIGITLLVDASIIAVENMVRRLAEDENKNIPVIGLVCKSIKEVATPIFSSTLIIISVFFPLFMLGGVEGKMFKALSFTVCASMGASLLLSLTMTPVLSTYLLKRRKEEKEGRIYSSLKKGYRYILTEKVLKHPKLFLALSIAAVLLVLGSGMFLSTEFIPEVDEGSFLVIITLSPDISLGESLKMARLAERLVHDIPDVTETITSTGRAEETTCTELSTNITEMHVSLKPPGERSKSKKEIEQEIRDKLKVIPGAGITVVQPFYHRLEESIAGTPATISVKLFGPDMKVLIEKGKEIEEIMEKVPGVEDLRMEQVIGMPQLQIKIKRKEAARYGITACMVSEYIRLAIGGEAVTQLWQDKKHYDVFIRLKEEYRSDPEKLEDLLLDTPVGIKVPLGKVADIYRSEAPNIIRHEALTRRIAIDCNVSGADTGGVVTAIKAEINKKVTLPKDYYITYGGEYENQEKAFNSLTLAVLFSLFIVFIIIFSTLNSLPVTMIIMMVLPSSFVGGILALHITGATLNVSSAIGFIALMGITVQNSLILFTNIIENMEEGLSDKDAIIKASVERVRPKLMTVLCAILGLIPLVITTLPGTEMQKPMGIVLIGGLFTSTICVLFILPIFYDMYLRFMKDRKQKIFDQLRRLRKAMPF